LKIEDETRKKLMGSGYFHQVYSVPAGCRYRSLIKKTKKPGHRPKKEETACLKKRRNRSGFQPDKEHKQIDRTIRIFYGKQSA